MKGFPPALVGLIVAVIACQLDVFFCAFMAAYGQHHTSQAVQHALLDGVIALPVLAFAVGCWVQWRRG